MVRPDFLRDGGRAAHEALRDDIRRLEKTLRQSGITRHNAPRCLVALIFIKWYEEMRELRGDLNRFTADGFAAYRSTLVEGAATQRDGYTLRCLLADEFGEHATPERAALRDGVAPAEELDDNLIQTHVLRVLDKHRLLGTERNTADAMFDAVMLSGDKDVRTGQDFTPNSVARFAVGVVRPTLKEVVLDPAAGAGTLLRCTAEFLGLSAAPQEDSGGRIEEGSAIGRVLGCDTEPGVTSVARMSLYMNGGSAEDVRVENGLLLADLPVFGAPLLDAVDACITDPPLGRMSFRHAAAELVRRRPAIGMDEETWLRTRLPLVHGQSGDRGAAGGRAFGESTKAGALFLSATWAFLKSASNPEAPAEWRGGRLGIILDEAILNTAEHARTRAFVRRHYYVKAVFSFGRDAFWHEARTTAKMSLVYLVKKGEVAATQLEPTFLAHAERTGINRRGRSGPSDLPDVLDAYLGFEAAVRAAYQSHQFDAPAARRAIAALDLPRAMRVQWPDEVPGGGGARMDYAHAAALCSEPHLRRDFHELRDFVRAEVRLPAEDPWDCYTFATIDRSTGEVRTLGEAVTRYRPRDLRVVRTGDIVVSGIDLGNGAAGYAYAEADGLVLSREFYTLTLRAECADAVDPRFLALLLRTPQARKVVAGHVTGFSGRTRIKNADELLGLPIPPFPPIAVQHKIVTRLERALAGLREADAEWARILEDANGRWSAAPSWTGTARAGLP
jgi:type I restriction enzyme M protein